MFSGKLQIEMKGEFVKIFLKTGILGLQFLKFLGIHSKHGSMDRSDGQVNTFWAFISDYEPRQVLFWVNDTEHAFKFRNNNSANETITLEKLNFTTISLVEPDDESSLTTEKILTDIPVTEKPNWKQTFDKTLDSVFNRQKRFSNDSNESSMIDDAVEDGDSEGEHIAFSTVN